ncbi:protein OCTOPUS-like [Benincasa hispida]|uniref:protein OCTOPUS-like n=1 Tax=Benincasa hispida TaxID=102211 RepID=UPI001900C7EE|nr:protein OCTOPUS-like [Benincasa hispida]
MNPSTDEQPAPPPLPPPLPPLPHRPSAPCPRHPQEHFTAFCPLCLCERLSVLDSSASAASSSSSRKPHSTAASALRAIFRPAPPNRPSSFFPELRRAKSFSASKNEAFSAVFEPQRKSCDVRLRNTLCSLFSQDASASSRLLAAPGPEIILESKNLEDPISSCLEPQPDGDGEIRVSGQPNVVDVVIENGVQEIVEEEEEEIQVELGSESVQLQEEFKTMKDHIDLDSHTKKPAGRGSFWSAASVFSKKLQKWRDKQKEKKQRNGGGSTTLPVEKPIGRHFRETQSEIADYGFGRRSCDIDPRFSLDAGRMSFDDPRYSFDEPRASWDGYLISRTFPRMPTMLSVVEDAPIHVFRSDTQIPVEDSINSTNEDENIPGGSSQTRDYYSDSSSRRRKSLDRSNSIRKTAAAVVAEIDDMKSSVSNAKVSPATTDVCHGPKLAIPDRDSNSNSMRDDCSGSFDDAASVVGTGNRKEESKKSKGWGKGWKIWGLINRRGGNKDEEEDRESSRPNGVERSYSESWPELRGDRNGDVKGGFNPKMFRSNSSVSWRSSSMMGSGYFSSSRKSNAESNGNGKKKKEEPQPVLERNRSARHSPTNVDNGLLRFYLTPLRGSRRGGSGKVKPNQAQSIARSVLRLY